MGIQYFKRLYSWLDFTFMLINIFIIIQFIDVIEGEDFEDYQKYR